MKVQQNQTNVLTHVVANANDATPELLAHVMDLLLVAIAPQAVSVSVMMKINVTTKNLLLKIVFKHTTTLGIHIQCSILRAALVRCLVKV